ncbi:MAG: hypothetical protein EOP49_25925, partial [Sphingobacteriales bacterium]
MNISRTHPLKQYLLISSFALLTACGNGGGGDDGGGGSGGVTSSSAVAVSSSSAMSSSSSSSVASLVANPGPSLTFDMGDTVTLNPHAIVANPNDFSVGSGNLEVKGTSTNPMDIVAISWTLISGPEPTLITTGTTTANATFVAPSTDGAGSVDIIYKLTLTRQDGQTAEANVTYTIQKVNQAPAANAGSTNTVKGLSTVTLNALGTDSDGTIASYAWTQIGTDNLVALSTPNSSTTSFIAPSTNSNLDLTFQIEVTDSDGAKATSQVLIHVIPQDAPQVTLHFPPATGVYKGSTISAFGTTTVSGATISSVSVDTGAGPIAATVNPDGSWRVDNLPVPGTTTFTLNVTAMDSLNRTGTTTSTLSKSATSNGSGQTWSNATGLAIDSKTNTAYVLATGSSLSEARLFPIDLSNGNRGNDISNFSYAAQGIRSSGFQRLTFDEANHRMYVSIFPATTLLHRQIISVDTNTGMRNLISDPTRGTGNAFISP